MGIISGLKVASAPLRKSIARRIYPSELTYAGCGEDLIAAHWIRKFELDPAKVRYLDIGASDPETLSNTYLMYRCGGSGVLVDPDPRYGKQIGAKRPRDVFVPAAAAFEDSRQSRLIRMSNPMFNCFSIERAERVVKASADWSSGKISIMDAIDVPLLPVNEILRDHFSSRSPHFISIDAEETSLQILRTIDLDRFSPAVICIESDGIAVDEHLAILGRGRFRLVQESDTNYIFVQN